MMPFIGSLDHILEMITDLDQFWTNEGSMKEQTILSLLTFCLPSPQPHPNEASGASSNPLADLSFCKQWRGVNA